MKITRIIGLCAVFAFSHAAHALIIYDTGSDTDNSYNTTAPGNGAPWMYVGEVTNTDVSTDASAVYLGNGFMITAHHVNLGPSVLLDGTSYSIDYSYTPTQIGTADLELFKISGDPGLATLPLAGATDNDLNMNSTMVGWGKGKGSVISGQGWTWGGDSTRTERWGTNVTLATLAADGGGILYLETSFNVSLGADTASATEGDSGSALFQNYSGTWKLAGIYVGVDTANASYYSGSPNNVSGMDSSYAVELKPYSALIEADIPEPGSVALLGLGAGACVFYARRRRNKRL